MRRAGFPLRHLAFEASPDDSAWFAMLTAVGGRLYEGSLSILIGGRGTGKTQAAVCVAQSVERSVGDLRAIGGEAKTRYTTAVELFMAIKETYGDNAQRSERAAMDLFIKPELLVIDEVQERAGTEWEQRLLTAIVDKRYAGMKDTILVGNMKPESVQAELGTSICSRAQETGGIYIADWTSFRAKKSRGVA